jgi:hypothetical protein
MSYGPNLAEMHHQAGVCGTDSQGCQAGRSAGVTTHGIPLVINLKAAKALSLTVLSSLLIRADEVIE